MPSRATSFAPGIWVTSATETYWTGRREERITVRGKKVDPSDLEPILFEIAGLRQGCFVAFGVDNTDLGTQRLVIVSEVRTAAPDSLEQIAQEIRQRILAGLDVMASEIILVAEGSLPKTSSGKHRHRHFGDTYPALPVRASSVLYRYAKHQEPGREVPVDVTRRNPR